MSRERFQDLTDFYRGILIIAINDLGKKSQINNILNPFFIFILFLFSSSNLRGLEDKKYCLSNSFASLLP